MKRDSAFNMKEYIRKRMLEIEQLEDRNLYKTVVGDLLLQVYEYNQAAYTKLEDQILNESSAVQNRFSIYLAITDRAHYDATDTFLYPMCFDDTKAVRPSFQDLIEAQREERELKLYTVFCKASASGIYELLHDNRTFSGTIRTEKQTYPAVFCLKRNEQYLDQIKELYDIFAANHQLWSTVCEAYLTKMLDVTLVSAPKLKAGEKLVDFQVDFAEYSPLLYQDMIPLWNLSPVTEKTSTYTTPCIDKVNFEHKIFSHRLKRGCEYLVRNRKVEITNIRRVHGDLYITCPIEAICEWQLYQVNKRTGNEHYLYPVLTNQCKESFAGAITEMYCRSIKTKSELARLIESFPFGDYVVFRDIRIQDKVPAECIAGNYNMDGFIPDEIRAGNRRQALVIDFEAVDPGHYLNEDVMSFLVTQVQKIFSEYQCVGRLV